MFWFLFSVIAACDYMRDVRGSVETLLLYANQH
jgi:hypothetical protein